MAPAGRRRLVARAACNVRAIVVLSSGTARHNPAIDREMLGDMARYVRYDVARVVHQGDIVIAVGFNGRANDRALADLAEQSGGWFVDARKGTDLAAEADRVMTDLHNRYLLGFVPTSFDGKDHPLQVRVNRPGVTVRARAYYQAPVK